MTIPLNVRDQLSLRNLGLHKDQTSDPLDYKAYAFPIKLSRQTIFYKYFEICSLRKDAIIAERDH
jgi:hypothetical protein